MTIQYVLLASEGRATELGHIVLSACEHGQVLVSHRYRVSPLEHTNM